jgi:hypothetical protein
MWITRTASRLAVVVAGTALLVAACGGANDAGGPATSSPASANVAGQSPSGPAYAQCMRQHGVTNFPDPRGANQNSFLITPSVTRNTHYKSASTACESLRPRQSAAGGGGPNQRQLLAFAQCMRANGEPKFPDPAAGGAITLGGVDPNSPQFQHAMQACQAKTGLHLGGQ